MKNKKEKGNRSKVLPPLRKWEQLNLRTLIIWAIVAVPLTVAVILVCKL
jgi:hypothetical protein